MTKISEVPSSLQVGGPHCVLVCGAVIPPNRGVNTQKNVSKLVGRMSVSRTWRPSHSSKANQQG